MNPFYKALEKLRNEEDQVWLQLPEMPESFLSFSSNESQPMDQDDDPTLDGNLPSGDELEDNEVTFVKASLSDESKDTSTSIPLAASHTPDQQEILGTGSLNIRLIDQYPCYGVSDKGELTLIGDSPRPSTKTTDAKAEVRSGSFLEESDFSLVTEDNIPERVCKSIPTVSRKRSHISVAGFVQDSDTNIHVPQKRGKATNCRTAETTSHSLHQPCEPSPIERPQVSITPDRNACVTQKVPLLEADLELAGRQIPQDEPFFLELFSQMGKTLEVPTPSQVFQQKDISLTPSVRPALTPNMKAGRRFPQTPQTATSSRLTRFSKFATPSQNPAVRAPVQFPQLFNGIAPHGTERQGPSEKSMLVQNVRNLPVALSKQYPSVSEATGRTSITPNSLLDVQVPFEFEDPNVNVRNRRSAAIHETLHGVVLDPNQILENEELIRRAGNMVGKRPLPTPDHSFVTPAKRIRSEYSGSKMNVVQPSPRDVSTMFGDVQMSPITVPTQPVLMNKYPAQSLGPTLTSRMVVQNLDPKASLSPHMIPNNAPNPPNPVLMYSMNHNDTNVRSEDVDLPKRHHCKACLAVFAFKENCDRHYKVVHLKRQVFRCPHCTSSYLQPKTMRGHIDKKHCIRTDEVSILPCYWCPAKLSNHEEWELHAAQTHPEQRSKFRGMSP